MQLVNKFKYTALGVCWKLSPRAVLAEVWDWPESRTPGRVLSKGNTGFVEGVSQRVSLRA